MNNSLKAFMILKITRKLVKVLVRYNKNTAKNQWRLPIINKYRAQLTALQSTAKFDGVSYIDNNDTNSNS